MSTPLLKTATPLHAEVNKAMKEVLARYQDRLGAVDMLAIASHFVGVLIAAQDQRVITADMALEIVQANIERGNAEAIAGLDKTAGSA